MASFFAAGATDILFALLLVSILLIVHVIVFIILGLMHAKLATELIFANFAAAPPHLASVLALMLAT